MSRTGLALVYLLLVVHTGASEPWRAVLLPSGLGAGQELQSLRDDGVHAVVLRIEGDRISEVRAAAERVLGLGLDLHYWLEIGRNPSLAEAHPEWMASIQGHQAWRRDFPDFPPETTNEVVKAYPWVPVGYEESFQAHVNRVRAVMGKLPSPAAVWLNNLQGPPSACGCGHPLCRWTTDYGPKRTATLKGNAAAAQFVREVQTLMPGVQVFPVWVTECEEQDRDGLCGGVGCYGGRCWQDWTEQLAALAKVAPVIGVMATYEELQRDLPRYGSTGAWVGDAVRAFQTMPTRWGHPPLLANRFVAVVQGWKVSASEVEAQIEQATSAGAAGILIARLPIDQTWSPQIVECPSPHFSPG